MRVGSLHKIVYAYTEASVLRKNLHGIWVKGDVNRSNCDSDWGLRYMRVDVGMPAMFVADYNDRFGIFLVEDQFVELKYDYLEEL